MGELYEAKLAELYVVQRTLYDVHAPHEASPARDGSSPCRCGQGTMPARPAEHCPADTICDELGDALYVARRDQFSPAEAADWLADIGPELFGWVFDEVYADRTVADAVVAALDFDAFERIYPDQFGPPVDPATTKPSAAHQEAAGG